METSSRFGRSDSRDAVEVGRRNREHANGMLMGCLVANLQVKDVPEPLHRKIRAYAKRRGRTVRDVVLDAVTREIEREEFQARLAKREPVDLGRPAARALEEVRKERERALRR